MGRRVEKRVYTYQAASYQLTTTSRFIYDGWNLIEERETRDSQPETRYYIWGLDLSQSLEKAGGIGGLIASVDATTSAMYYFQYDANGNVGQLVNASDGSTAAAYVYDPFGNVIHSTGTLADDNPFLFSTKYFDRETGLYYYGYRYYSPEMGRWLTRDPIEELGNFILRNESERKTADLNLYGFCLNNPINLFDIYGLKRVKILDWERVTYELWYVNYLFGSKPFIPGYGPGKEPPGYDPHDLPEPNIKKGSYYEEVPDEYVLLNISEAHYKLSEWHIMFLEITHLNMTFYYWGCTE